MERMTFQPQPVTREMFVTLPQVNAAKDFTSEFANIDHIRQESDDANNVDTSGKLLSFDPVKPRNRYEQCQTPQERWEWRRNEKKEVTSTLRERYNCIESPMDFFVDEDGKLRNQEFSAEPLDVILERGVAYQERNNSQELERERAEVVGIYKVQEYFADPETEEGATMLVFSPPGMVEGSPYTKHFVDKYVLELDETTGERRIVAKRYATNMSYEEYQDAVMTFDPGYFDAYQNEPFDAYLLKNPLILEDTADVDDQLEAVLQFDPDALMGYEFDMVNEITDSFKVAVINAISEWKDPKEVAYAINTLYHIGDEANRLVREGDLEGLEKLREWSSTLTAQDVEEEIERKGGIPPAIVMVGCGSSEGFGAFSNSVGMFGVDAKNDPNLCQEIGCKGSKAHFHCGGQTTEVVKDESGKVLLDELGKEKKQEVACTYKVIVGDGTKRCPECGKGAVC